MSTVNQAEIQQAAIFMIRMLPFLMTGQSFEDAGKSVLSRDNKLMQIATSQTEEGEFIRKQMAADVYAEMRGQ